MTEINVTFSLAVEDKWMAKVWTSLPPDERRITINSTKDWPDHFKVGRRVEMVLSYRDERWELSGVVESCEGKSLVLRAATTEPPVKVWAL